MGLLNGLKRVLCLIGIFFCRLFYKGEWLFIAASAGLFALLLATIKWFGLSSFDNYFDITVFSAIVVEGLMRILIDKKAKPFMKNKIEDERKLTSDYSELAKSYKNENKFVWTQYGDEENVIPVIHEAWLFNKEFIINDDPKSQYKLPGEVLNYYGKLMAAHDTSTLYNNNNIRVDDWFLHNDIFYIKTGRTTYFDSMVTNRAMDYELDANVTVREMLEFGPSVNKLKESKLSNHLGVNGFVESVDGEIVFVYRSKDVSIGKGTFGNSVGASLKYKYICDSDGNFTQSGLENGIIKEIEDELGIKEAELLSLSSNNSCLKKVKYIAAYRDMVEGGKPQLLFYAKSSLERDKIEDIFKEKEEKRKKDKKKRKKNSRGKKEKKMKRDGKKLYWIKTDALKDCEIYSDRIELKGKKKAWNMMPSASACVDMFVKYLDENEFDYCKTHTYD